MDLPWLCVRLCVRIAGQDSIKSNHIIYQVPYNVPYSYLLHIIHGRPRITYAAIFYERLNLP